MSLDQKLNELKKIRKLTNSQLSQMTGITISTIDKITSGNNTNPKLRTIEALCEALNCTLDDLLDNKCTQRTDKKIALTENEDEQKKQLLHNYDKMNETAQNTLIKYSEFMASQPENLKIKADNNKMNA